MDYKHKKVYVKTLNELTTFRDEKFFFFVFLLKFIINLPQQHSKLTVIREPATCQVDKQMHIFRGKHAVRVHLGACTQCINKQPVLTHTHSGAHTHH